MTPSDAVTIALALGVASLLPLAARRTGRRGDVVLGAGFVALVLSASGVLAGLGALRDFASTPPPVLRLLLLTTLSTLAVGLSPFGGRLARAVSLWALVGFQSFRILVELLLWILYRAGLIPVQMTFEGANFDVVTGILALALGAALLVRRVPVGFVWAWNVLGLATLVNIVAIAALSMPTGLRLFHVGPANTLVTTFPYVWIPCVFVQAALLGHVLIFRSLRHKR